LKSLEQVENYLLRRIEREPEIEQGVVLAVDAVSCANTFVGMRHVEEGGIAYLFVIHLQPLTPKSKCSPLFIIDSRSGMADAEVQAKIDEVLMVTQSRIHRVFLASDGDPSYNNRHHAFKSFWEPIFEQFGLERLLLELKTYRGPLPLSDFFHLGKNLRTRFLKYFLTFILKQGERLLRKSVDPSKMRRILDLGAPLTDLTQVGKMRDVYPLVIARVEHIITLFENNGIAEAVVWLPITFTLNSLRLETITRETMLFTLRIAFFLVWYIYKSRKLGIDRLPEKSKKKITSIFTSQWMDRFLDTALLHFFSIENYKSIAIDRASTHPLENYFGQVRMDSHDVNTPEAMTNTIAHTNLVRDAYDALELDGTIPGRVNLAGVQILEGPPDSFPKKVYDIVMENSIPPETIAQICLKAVHAQEGALTSDEEIAFLQFRDYLTHLKRAADESRTSADMRVEVYDRICLKDCASYCIARSASP
jgi:hypothetical protein